MKPPITDIAYNYYLKTCTYVSGEKKIKERHDIIVIGFLIFMESEKSMTCAAFYGMNDSQKEMRLEKSNY